MHAANVLPIIRQIAVGGMSLRQIADELNTRGSRRRGWPVVVRQRNIMARGATRSRASVGMSTNRQLDLWFVGL